LQQLFLTPGGTALFIRLVQSGASSTRDGFEYVMDVEIGDVKQRVMVDIDALVQMEPLSAGRKPDPRIDTDLRHVFALLAIVDAVDRDPSFVTGAPSRLELGVDQAQKLLSRPKPSDREIRRYLARWVYTVYSTSTLDVKVKIDRIDELLLGCTPIDMKSNLGILQAEGYLSVAHVHPPNVGVAVTPTVRLVRDVERFGAARDDVVAESDYPASIAAYPILAPQRAALVAEWARYTVARSAGELLSVFRALAPIAEATVRQVLASHGSRRSDTNLAPMIQELQSRGLGNRALWSKLNHIVVFARDLAEHGDSLTEPVLRIACETVFDLLPQVAALARPAA
jgi:hypothetical protein